VNLREWFDVKPHCIHRTWRELPIDQSGDWLEVSSRSICTDCGTHHIEFRLSPLFEAEDVAGEFEINDVEIVSRFDKCLVCLQEFHDASDEEIANHECKRGDM